MGFISSTTEQEADQLQPRAPRPPAQSPGPLSARCSQSPRPSTAPRRAFGHKAGAGVQAGDAQGSDSLILRPPSKLRCRLAACTWGRPLIESDSGAWSPSNCPLLGQGQNPPITPPLSSSCPWSSVLYPPPLRPRLCSPQSCTRHVELCSPPSPAGPPPVPQPSRPRRPANPRLLPGRQQPEVRHDWGCAHFIYSIALGLKNTGEIASHFPQAH